jgi:hypothetical protein
LILLKHVKKKNGLLNLEKVLLAMQQYVERENYIYLGQLEIQYKYQRRGLGTALVKSIISEINLPIQLICSSNLEGFYSRLGFETIVIDGTGLRMQRAGTRPTLGIEDLDKVQLPENYVLSILKGEEKWVAQRFLVKQWWTVSAYFKRISLIFLLISVFCFFVINYNFWIQVYFLFGIGILPFLIGCLPHYYLSLNSPGKPLISVYLSWRVDYAEIYVFSNTNVTREQDIKAALIQHVAKVVDVPVYLVCDRRHSDFYTGIGFTPIAKRKLPFLMRILSKSSGIAMCYPAVCE